MRVKMAKCLIVRRDKTSVTARLFPIYFRFIFDDPRAGACFFMPGHPESALSLFLGRTASKVRQVPPRATTGKALTEEVFSALPRNRTCPRLGRIKKALTYCLESCESGNTNSGIAPGPDQPGRFDSNARVSRIGLAQGRNGIPAIRSSPRLRDGEGPQPPQAIHHPAAKDSIDGHLRRFIRIHHSAALRGRVGRELFIHPPINQRTPIMSMYDPSSVPPDQQPPSTDAPQTAASPSSPLGLPSTSAAPIWLSPDGAVSYVGRFLTNNAPTLTALGAGIAQGGIGCGLQLESAAAPQTAAPSSGLESCRFGRPL
jgi:hypothetical protein